MPSPITSNDVEAVAEADRFQGPVVQALSPTNWAVVGGDDFTLSVIGAKEFPADAVIVWNGGEEPTTVVSPTELTTGVQPSTATTPTELPVLVRGTLDNVGVVESNTVWFYLLPPPGSPKGSDG